MQNYTSKGPLFTQASKWHSKTHPSKSKTGGLEMTPSHPSLSGLALNLDISEQDMLPKNIKLGYWIQGAYPLKTSQRTAANFCF